MKKTNLGILFGLITYILWGFLSLYWKLLSGVNSYNTFSYRIIFTVLTMLVYMVLSKNKERYRGEIRQLISHKQELAMAVLASFLIALNWLTYIFAVSHQQATQASFGYYIMLLVSILLALVFLHERLSPWMTAAIIIAGIGVGILAINIGQPPLVSILLAVTFALYGLVKKNVKLSSDVAMLVESSVVAPFVLIYLLFFSKESLLDYSLLENVLLLASGIVTAIPLLLFAEAVKRAPLNIIGFIQYINPTIQLAIAVFVFHEKVGNGEVSGFIFIWIAIAIFILGQLMSLRKKSR
ncbi:EamA family transporter RarD [Streptococcus pasteurianus]|uniref:EamA family transporter RarD n=1 Tax=Streptococcus pasteurianus TaxID=197614 RepID=UPI0010A830B2|nr:EamA family transporter RarD [Streptococcus pasteurianus]MDV5120231.1 EamA family transporter RarD [Streptococcus pasteurianus]MDV5125920.1 EamA family transporter RarD [Streptococcus pasteurianus]MDV5153872.1 EamA family transporter RarD [Streptococcus pasteurianus]QCE36897.1 EamA family transporter RarD [Streptococcus pasteurianus]